MPRTYSRIYVPVDKSGYSFAAIDLAVELASKLGASIIGSHAGSAASDSYLGLLEECCRTASIPFERRTLDGRRHRALLEDIRRNHSDLVVMGALGAGAVDESQIGSVAERVVRKASTDVLVVKDLLPDPDGRVLTALDGSRASMEALSAGLELARGTGRSVEGIVVGESGVSGPASAAIEAARAAAAVEGTDLEIVAAEGKPFDRILKTCREKRPWLLVVGRTGLDADADEREEIGSNTANLLRLSPCNILVTPSVRVATHRRRLAGPAIAAALPPATPRRTLRWTPEAERLLEDVPSEQRLDVIRTVEEGARRLGIFVVTAETIDKVMLGYIDS
ncbi:MAG TPA: universal stress protein [Candidatus Polarisedimenticolia bacterium]|nr:universal stress protein [Candidatus Polarisedimenticolia bacterium]